MIEARAGLLLQEKKKTVILFGGDRILAKNNSFSDPLELQELRGDVFGREHGVGLAGCNGRERHAVEFRGQRVLDEHGPPDGPDRLASAGPVRSRSGEDHRAGAFARVPGQR